MQKKDQLEKEKYLYALELQLPDYEEENIIWAEDLFDVDIIVYTGHLDELPLPCGVSYGNGI